MTLITKMKIKDFFNVEYGQKELENKGLLQGEEGQNIVISSKGEDNGIYGFYNISNGYKAPVISVPRTGTIGQAFVQLKDCSIDNNCLVLIPKKDLSIEQLFQVAFQIRLTKWKYKYGRQITPKRIKDQEINISSSKIKFDELSKKINPKKSNKIEIKPTIMKPMKIKDLCKIEKKTALPQNVINSEGNIPYISSSSKNNGVVMFVDEEPNFKAGSLTVAKDGNDGISFYQPFDFITSLHNYVLTPKNNLPKWILLYIGAIIRIKCYGYNHYYPLSKKHLERMEIEMPINDEKIDLDYIEKIVKNTYGFKEVEQYL